MMTGEPKGTLFIISGPSGAGKTTILQRVLDKLGQGIVSRITTYTTKKPRPGDVSGIDYHFISEDEFSLRMQEGFFIEHSTSYNAFYGSPISIIDQLYSGKSLITVLDYNGVKALTSKYPRTIPIWMGAAHEVELKSRLIQRAAENMEEIKHRMVQARYEALEEKELQLFKYHIVNEKIESSVEQLELFIRTTLSLN